MDSAHIRMTLFSPAIGCVAILSHLKELFFFLGSQYIISFKKYHVEKQHHFFNGIHEAKV